MKNSIFIKKKTIFHEDNFILVENWRYGWKSYLKMKDPGLFELNSRFHYFVLSVSW